MKKIFALATLLFTIMLVGVCAQAADFEPVTTVFKNGTAFEAYTDQINMKDGNDGYTFEMLSEGLYPAGITISSDGAVTGTPTVSGAFSNIYVRMTKGDESRVAAFSIRILPKKIRVSVAAGTYQYDGQNHFATVKCYDPDDLTTELTNVTPVIKYGAKYLDAARDVGEYVVNVYAPSGYSIVKPVLGDTLLEITPLPVTSILVNDYSTEYTGNPISMPSSNISVNPNISYVVDYMASDSSSYTTTPPTAAGVYTVRVHTNDSNYETVYAEATMTIRAQGVVFTVTGDSNVPYDTNPHYLTVSSNTPDAAFTYTYIDAATGAPVEHPTNAGTYNLSITFTNPGKYSIGSISGPTTLVITPKQIKFTVPASLPYTGAQQIPTVTTDPAISADMYTVSYTLSGGSPQSYVQASGAYDITFSFKDEYKDNYAVSADSSTQIGVAVTAVNFSVTGNTTYEYDDGQNHVVNVTPNVSGLVLGTDYEVTYTNGSTVIKQSEKTSGPSDVGTYRVDAVILNTTSYSKGTFPPTTLTVNPKPVEFAITGASYTSGDNQPHVATVTPSVSGLVLGIDYEITYTKGSTVIKQSENANGPSDEGTYTVGITILNSSYSLQSADNAEVIIASAPKPGTLNYGNSPAAMIYKDTAAEHDDAWKADAVAYLTANRKFGTYLPTGFESYIGDITYPLIGNIDIDSNPYTVLVSGYDISGFVDPGMVVDGNTITGSAPVLENSINGLYKVTYTDSDTGSELGWRYVVLVNRIGDANGNKMVNAIDANYIEKYVNEGSGSNFVLEDAIKSRAWDVTKDGKIDADDYNAIRNRFRTPLVPYYSWIEN